MDPIYEEDDPLFDNPLVFDNLHLRTDVVELPGDLSESGGSFTCPRGALVGAYNEGGTSNMRDLTKFKCMNFSLELPNGDLMTTRRGATSTRDIEFEGNNEWKNTSCPDGQWVIGFSKKGGSNNPNEARIVCGSIHSDGSVGRDWSTTHPLHDTVTISPGPNTGEPETGWSTKGKWGQCGSRGAVHGVRVVDRGTNLRDIHNLRCSNRSVVGGKFAKFYAELKDDPVSATGRCCNADKEVPFDDQAAFRMACAALGHSDDLTSGNCTSLGTQGYCLQKTIDGAPLIEKDGICKDWCEMYPLECDTAKMVWCSLADNKESRWCDCINRADRRAYDEFIKQFPSAAEIGSSCWYIPCKEEQLGILTTKTVRDGRTECPSTIINQTLYVDGDGNIINADFKIINNTTNVDLPPGDLSPLPGNLDCDTLKKIYGDDYECTSSPAPPPPPPPEDDDSMLFWIIVIGAVLLAAAVAVFAFTGDDTEIFVRNFDSTRNT